MICVDLFLVELMGKHPGISYEVQLVDVLPFRPYHRAKLPSWVGESVGVPIVASKPEVYMTCKSPKSSGIDWFWLVDTILVVLLKIWLKIICTCWHKMAGKQISSCNIFDLWTAKRDAASAALRSYVDFNLIKCLLRVNRNALREIMNRTQSLTRICQNTPSRTQGKHTHLHFIFLTQLEKSSHLFCINAVPDQTARQKEF